MKIRKQLTLFVPKKDAEIIEFVREKFNPIQKKLIDAHITLCREDEIEDLEEVLQNLKNLKNIEIKIEFGVPEKFKEQNGVYLPAQNTNAFDELRGKIISNPRKQIPHITLMHPRNSECTHEIFAQIQNFNFPKEIIFNEICLIEQIDEKKWNVIAVF